MGKFLKLILTQVCTKRSLLNPVRCRSQNIRFLSVCSLKYNRVIEDETKMKYDKNVTELLDDAALGEGPYDTVDEDDNWRTSPYPVGAVLNDKQTQARQALRPKVDPRETSIILFPGQGSQYVGMGKQLLKFPAARDIFEAANEILQYDLLSIMLNGPIEKLNKTIYSQPAIVVSSLAAIEKLKEERPGAIENCMATAGFSIGEITALTFAGVFSFDTAIKLVKVRAEAMQLASELVPSGMDTVICAPGSKLGQACLKAKEWCIERGIEDPECRVANFICPSIKVVAGHLEALKYLEENASVYKLERVTRLPVSGAFHSNLMLDGVEQFKKKLRKLTIRQPIISVHSNVNGKRYRDAAHVYRQLPVQMCRSVRWEQTMHILYERAKGSYHPETVICGPDNGLHDCLKAINALAAKSCYNIF